MAEPEANGTTSEAAKTPGPSASFRMTLAGIKKKFPRVNNISTAILSDWMNNSGVAEKQNDVNGAKDVRKIVIFDVRPLEEYNVSHIPSAIHLDPETQDMEYVKQIIQESGNETGVEQGVTAAVMYCSVGYRSSAMACKVGKSFGDPYRTSEDHSAFSNIKVYNLEGSIFQWANENRPLVDSNDQPTQYVHPYNRLWGLLIDRSKWKWSA